MKKFLIISLHLLLPSFGFLEYCFSRGIRRLRYNIGYHYSSKIHYEHPAYQNVSISIEKIPQEPHYKSYMLCTNVSTRMPQYIIWTLPLN